ncbi:MAG: phosphoribosylaminoimidazolecarboxamide formyltransferase [Chloroflexi bacterium]|jgi:phosphoribosylaminoimidazolecarboxamide formyltransferase/IMP cyclohydrolase|nr:phosphoribosylaminoimidazolecarboxamide formyltransferase [Chloroflexota bacterium]
MPTELTLRYGMNPHQAPARVAMPAGAELPFEVLSGAPGYINLLDALNSWALVRELRDALGLPAAASFKHVSPAGAALGLPLTDAEKAACFVDDLELSPLASAYARARGADRMSSFGDWVALSDTCDLATARIIRREVSDGVIAPGYEPRALEVLRAKRDGAYRVLRIDPAYRPAETETRQVYGVTLEQRRNDVAIGPDLFANVATQAKDLSPEALRDLILATVTVKYTQSNSVCLAHGGQVTGVGAGQQSRVHCTRLAAGKSDLWFLRQHPAVLGLPFRDGVRRAERNNAIDLYFIDDLTPPEEAAWRSAFRTVPTRLTREERQAWLGQVRGVALSSDAFFPFRDSIDRASRSGVRYVAQPGGSANDGEVIAACDAYGMTMALTGLRLFHH